MCLKRTVLFFFSFTLSIFFSHAQQEQDGLFDPASRGPGGLRLVFYNVENLFEPGNDPYADDDAFTPEGKYQWNYGKYRKKLINTAKTILAMGGWEAPGMIGLAEIENWQVLYDLAKKTPLNKYDYRIIHENSKDVRGIDVGVLYRPEKLEELSHLAIPYITGDSIRPSRDILYVRFLVQKSDTVHVFVNHWPSRLGGKDVTSGLRKRAALRLRQATDSLLRLDRDSKIVIMGDFNDAPEDESIKGVLGAVLEGGTDPDSGLYDLMYPYKGTGKGTIYHRGVTGGWNIFDQIIISAALLGRSGLIASPSRAFIFSRPWLLDAGTGRPNRTFKGPVFTGGYSDHLPVYFDLEYKKTTFNQ